MALTASLNSKTATSIVIDLAGRTPGTYDRIEYQYSTRPDFAFALAPIANIATAAEITISGLNQDNTYFVRVRECVGGGGAVGPWTATIAAYLPVSVAQDPTPLAVMLRPAMIVVPEIVTWSAVVEDTARPADNLASDSPAEQAWFSGALKFDTPGSPIDTIALLGTNLPAGATWTAKGYATAAGRDALDGSYAYFFDGGSFQASPGLPGRPHYNGLMRMPALRYEPYWALEFAGVAPPAGETAAMFGVVGRARTAKNIAADKVETPIDLGALERTRDAIPDRRYGWRGRRVDFEIAMLTEAQWETQFSDLRSKVGLTDPVLAVPNTRAGAFLHDRILYGPLTAHRAQQPYTPRFTQDYTIDSLI